MKKLLHSGRFLNFVDVDSWEFIERRCSGVVAIVPITVDDEVVLIEQYRRAVEHLVIELPAGLVGDDHAADEDPVVAARRELIEETGFDSDYFEFLAESPSSPGLTSEVVRYYVARDVRKVEDGGGVAGEEITVHVVPRAKVRNWLDNHDPKTHYVDPKVWAGLWLTG